MSRVAILLLAARIVSAATTLVVLAVIARMRGVDDLGLVAVGLTIGLLITAVSEAGSSSLLIREASRHPDRIGQLLGFVLGLRAVTLPTSMLIAAVIIVAIFPDRAVLVIVVAAGLPLQQVPEIARSVMLTDGRAGLLALHSIIENSVWVAAIIGTLALTDSLELAFGAGLAILVASALGGFVLLAVRGEVPKRLPWQDARVLLQQSAPFAAFSVLGAVSLRLDPLLIGWLASGNAIAAAGAYFSALRLVSAFEYFPEAVSRSMYPDLARSAHAGPSQFMTILRPGVRTLLGLAVPIPFLMLLGGGWMMGVAFGPELEGFGWLTSALAAAVPARFVAMLLGVSLTAADAHGRRVIVTTGAVVLSVGLQLLLLPRVGLAGSVIAWVVSAMFLFVAYEREIAQRFGKLPLVIDVGLSLIPAVSAFVVGWVVSMVIPKPFDGPLAVATFVAVSLPLVVRLRLLRMSPGPGGLGAGSAMRRLGSAIRR